MTTEIKGFFTTLDSLLWFIIHYLYISVITLLYHILSIQSMFLLGFWLLFSYTKVMKRLVFDIEVVAEDWDGLDADSQKNLTRYARDTAVNDAELAKKIEETKREMTFSPLTAKVIAIGVYSPDDERGAVYYDAGETTTEDTEVDGIKYAAMNEADMLTKFWALAEVHDEFISFYGRGLDVPFLMIRSAIHHIKPSKDLMSNRYNSSKFSGAVHYDLYDLLSFYGASRKKGSLHMWCRAFGIKSPKTEMDGSEVAGAYKDGRYFDIAKYNAADLRATAELFDNWDRYLKF